MSGTGAGDGRPVRTTGILRWICLEAHRELPVHPVAVLDRHRNRAANRLPAAHARENLRAVGFDRHATATAVPRLSPAQLGRDRVEVQRIAHHRVADAVGAARVRSVADDDDLRAVKLDAGRARGNRGVQVEVPADLLGPWHLDLAEADRHAQARRAVGHVHRGVDVLAEDALPARLCVVDRLEGEQRRLGLHVVHVGRVDDPRPLHRDLHAGGDLLDHRGPADVLGEDHVAHGDADRDPTPGSVPDRVLGPAGAREHGRVGGDHAVAATRPDHGDLPDLVHGAAAALGEDADFFRMRYGIQRDGNAPFDPQNEFTNKNLLYTAKTIDEIASLSGRSAAEVEAALQQARIKLLERRSRRPRPHLDDKVLTAWNGLMIAAFARAARVLDGQARFLEDARRAAEFIRRHLWDVTSRKLLRKGRRRKGRSKSRRKVKLPGYASEVLRRGRFSMNHQRCFRVVELNPAVRRQHHDSIARAPEKSVSPCVRVRAPMSWG